MAANPFLTCDSATSLYDFTRSLSWSSSCVIAGILSDIPFISVGSLVVGVSVLFLVPKRITLSTIWLFFSALLAFIAAVLDLGQTLSNEMVPSTPPAASEPTITAGSVLFALSIGFRFLFYWTYVAEPPMVARCATPTHNGLGILSLSLECTPELHSASWGRWGLPGKVLGVSLLIATIIITTLQIVWRVVPQFHRYSDVYAADAALELLVSFLLLLKLLLNTVTLDSPDSPIVHTLKECSAPITGLLINIVIGVGDLLFFAFTESTVGRLLQSFEVYIITVFVVVTAFSRHCDILLSIGSSQGIERRVVTPTLPEPARQSTFRIAIPFIEAPRMSVALDTANENKNLTRGRSARHSLNYVSSWLSPRIPRNRLRYEDEEVTLWNAKEGKLNPSYTGSTDTEMRTGIVSSTRDAKVWVGPVHDASANHMPVTSIPASQPTTAQSIEGSVHHDQTANIDRTNVPERAISSQVRRDSDPTSSIPPLISSGIKHTGSIAALPEASLVYGFDGIQSPLSASDSRTTLDGFLRQPGQLDQSIQALKLLSTTTSTNSSSSNLTSNPRNVELARSSSIGQRTVSSDVSLSNFPIPPWLTTPAPSLPSPSSSSVKRVRGDRRALLATSPPRPVQDTYPPLPPKTSVSLVDIPNSSCSNGVLHFAAGREKKTLSTQVRKPSSNSGGTQYNMASLIDARPLVSFSDSPSDVPEPLAAPGEPQQETSWCSTERKSSIRAIQAGSGTRLPLRTLPVPPRHLPRSLTTAKVLPLAHSSRLSQEDANANADAIQHQVNDQTSRSLTITLSLQTPAMECTENSIPIPPPKPQLMRGTSDLPKINCVDSQ